MEPQLAELQRAMGRIEGKLDMHLIQSTTTRVELTSLGKRVGKLEGWRWYVLGAFAAAIMLSNVYRFLI